MSAFIPTVPAQAPAVALTVPKGRSIGTLLTVLILLLLIPLLILLQHEIEGESSRIRSRTESSAMNVAQIAAHTIERQLADTHQFLTTLAARASVRALDTARCDPVFGDFQKSHPGFTTLTTTTLDGKLVCSSLGAPAANTPANAKADEIAARPQLKTPLATGATAGTLQFQVGRAERGFITARWVVPVSQMVFNDGGVANGAIAAWLDLLHLSPLNESTLDQLPKNTILTVFDGDGVILARSHNPEKWIGENRTGYPQATQALKQREGFFQLTSTADSINRLYAVVPVPGTHWVVSVGIPTSVMNAEIADIQRQGFLLLGVALSFAVLLLWLLRRYVVLPVRQVAMVASAVQQGDFERRIPPDATGPVAEIKNVASQFNAMLDTLAAERQQLAQNEAGFRTLFTEMRSGFAVHEILCDNAGTPVDYRFIAVNPAFEAMTGLRGSDLVGKRVLEVMPDTEHLWIERYGQVALTGEPAAFNDYSKVLGKYFDVRAFCPQPGQFGVMVLDITEQRLTEIALAQERSLLRRVIDTIPDLIFFKAADGRYLGCNQAFEAFAGRSEQQQIGKTDYDFFDHETAAFFRAQDRQMLASHQSQQNEEWVTYPDGRKVLLNTVKTPFANAQGETLGVLGISRDITAQHEAQKALKAQDETFKAMLATALDGFWIADIEGRLIEVNNAYVSMSGYPRESLIGMNISELDVEESTALVARRIRRIVATGGDRFETRHRRKDGSIWHAEVSANYWAEQRRQFVFIRDISQRKQAEDQLQQAAAVFENVQEGMMVTDVNEVIIRVNQAFTGLTGYSSEEAIGKNPSIMNSPNQDKKLFKLMRESLQKHGRWQGEITNRRKNGEDFPQWMTISSIFDTAGKVTHYVSSFSDITLMKQAEEKIHNLAFFDPLTQLPNRRLLLDRLHRALAASARRTTCGAVILIDLDHFKLLNETEGHEVGDQLLIEVARRLQNCVRDQDSVARQGGDEFIIILEDLGTELHEAASRAELVAEKILQSIGETYHLGALEHHSQASIGITMYHDQGESAEELLKRADSAMYRAKEAGRNTVRFFDPAMQVALENRIKLEAELRHALPGNELRLYYQAQVDNTGKILGAEVLIRWEHPQRGLVSPIQFIPLAEESGLILPIGTWVLEMACAQLKEWEKLPAARDLKLAVNVSPRQFRQTDFVSMTQHIVAQSGIDPSRLKLELTESIVIDNVADTIEKMHQLKSLGLTFSMDDFGTGYSSLAYLKRLPLDQLKIDQSFVRDISSDSNDAAIVQTIITMGNTLGMNVIAEGVETDVQLQFLRQHGCLAYQGYLFSRPVPLEAFQSLLEGGDPDNGNVLQGNLLI